MAEWVIGGIIAGYCIYLIIRKIKRIKKGNWCSGGCDGCSFADCPSKKEKKGGK